MMGSKPDADSEMFSKEMEGVKRIQRPNLVERKPAQRPPAIPKERTPNREETPNDAEADFLRPGIQKSVLRKLRNGQIPIGAELDLHGHTVQEADHELKRFLHSAQAPDRQRAVGVIHGKGLGSPERKAVLKHKVREWLRQSGAVLAFCTPASGGGGDGATHILLKHR